jgi:hypothetical protein
MCSGSGQKLAASTVSNRPVKKALKKSRDMFGPHPPTGS